ERIAENYRQLVLNYERRRDYATAEQFHIGEMEMARMRYGAETDSRIVRAVRQWTNGFTAYKIFSNYGTSYTLALIWLLVLVVVFSILVAATGFREVTPGSPDFHSIWDIHGTPAECVSQLVDVLRHAMVYMTSVLTFQRER